MFALLFSIAIFMFFGLNLLKWYKHYQKYSMSTIPGPKPLPIIGNLHEFGLDRTTILANFSRVCSKYNGICKLFMGPETVLIVVSHPKYLKKIFKNSSDHIEKSNMYDFFHGITGNGILCVKEPIWSINRKALQCAFQYNMLEEFNRVFNKVGNKLVRRFEEILGRQVDVCPYVNHATMDIIYQSILGLDFDKNPEENMRFSNSIYKYMDIAIERMFSPIKRFNFLFQFMPDHKRQQFYSEEIRSFTTKVVNKRLEEMKYESDHGSSDEADFGIKKKTTFLDILLERFKNEKQLPYDYINAELSTVLTAGHHTLTCFLSSILYELSKHSEIQEKLYEEVSSIIEDDKSITTKDTNAMEYLECVVKEGLRLYSPSTFFERILDYDIEIDNSVIPKGTNINIFAFHMHRSEQVYENALKFDPERFSAANNKGRDSVAFIPFSFGVRNCIGWKYAMFQMKCLLAKIIYNYRMQPIAQGFEPQLMSDGILKSTNGFPVNLSKR